MNKKTCLTYGLFLLLLASSWISCDEYERTEVKPNFYVNHQSLSLFVDEEIQLLASPDDGTYKYQWSSEDQSIATVSSEGKVKVVGAGNTNIIVTAGNITVTIPLTSAVRIPLQDVQFSLTSFIGSPGEEKTVLITYVPENANDIPKFTWTSEDNKVALVDDGGRISLIDEGFTNIVFRAGEIIKKIPINTTYTRPFKGPHILSADAPYVLPAANFDFGGEGYAFHDADAASHTGNTYRRDNGDPNSHAVEIEGNGANIGYTNPGEWLLYTVEVVDEGDYLIEAQVAVPGTGSFHIKVNGDNVTGTIGVPNTGGWGAYIWLSTPEEALTVNLTKGMHKIVYYFEGGHNFRALRFTKK